MCEEVRRVFCRGVFVRGKIIEDATGSGRIIVVKDDDLVDGKYGESTSNCPCKKGFLVMGFSTATRRERVSQCK